MKKRLISTLMILMILLSMLSGSALAAPKQMNDDVPVWSEETVKDYMIKYIQGVDLETLRGYYDLQVRRYMPMATYATMLTEIAWITGEFQGFGTYSSFAEPSVKTKTHVLHLCMEKQDLDVYFTHKEKEDDWEVMALEFVFAEKQEISDASGTADGQKAFALPSFTEEAVTVGAAPYELNGILTLPENASAETPVRACVLVHGSGPQDMNSAIGETKLFADLAKAFAERGIATLRYDKRTFTYGASMTPEEVAALTVEEETIQDAIAAGRWLQSHSGIDSGKIILVGHSMGAMLAPRIATEASDVFSAALMIAGTPKTLLEIMIQQNQVAIAKLKEEQKDVYEAQLAPIIEKAGALAKMKEEDAKQIDLFGVNAYYFWEMEQHDAIKDIKKLKIPIYIVQGSVDFQVPMEEGVEAYEDKLGDSLKNVNYNIYRGLNHLLMQYTGDVAKRGTVEEYDTPASLDIAAARDMTGWINGLWGTEE